MTQQDFAGLYARLRALPDIAMEAILPTDEVVKAP